ncbi:MAG: GAF domain-containing sensor histidine kinase [candidate division FCPU426 bacterium]
MPNPMIDRLLERESEVVRECLEEGERRFPFYRQAAGVQRSTIEEACSIQLKMALQALEQSGQERPAWEKTMRQQGETLARLGVPLMEVLGMIQLLKEKTRLKLQTLLAEQPEVPCQAIVEFDLAFSRIFSSIELDLLTPFLEVQTQIIQSQEAFLKHKFSSLYRLVEAISNNLDIQQCCELLLDYVCRFYDVKLSGVFLLDEKARELYPQHMTGLSRKLKSQLRYRAVDEPFRQCLQEGKPVFVIDTPYHADDITVPVPEREQPPQAATRSSADYPALASLYAPMIGRQRTYGVAALHAWKLAQFTESEVQQFTTLARIVAVALENAGIYQSLTEEKSKLDAIVNSISDGLILVDLREEIVFINALAAKYLQQPPYRLLGASASIIPDRLLANAQDPLTIQSRYLRAQNSIAEMPVLDFTLERPEVADIRMHFFPVRDREQRLMGHGLLIEDVSHEQEVNRMKTEFAAIASHTMRTPMTSILGFATLLIEKQLPAETQRKYIQNIYRESQRLTNIFNDMLDLANIEAGLVSLKLAPLDVWETAQTAARDVRALSNRTIELVRGNKTFPLLIADQQKVQQALGSLLTNATKFTAGKIVLQVKKVTQVKFRSGWMHSQVGLEAPGLFPAILYLIEDEGEGIPAEHLDGIFEAFHKVPQDKRWNEGSGLGLTIVRHIAEAHGGRVWVESAPGKGSAFSLLLPLELTSPETNVGRFTS